MMNKLNNTRSLSCFVFLFSFSILVSLISSSQSLANTDCYGDPCLFIRGDVNRDCNVDYQDEYQLLNFLNNSYGSEPPNHDAADVDDSGLIDWNDWYHLSYYLNGNYNAPPAAPFPYAGTDPSQDFLETQCDRVPEGIEVVSGDGQIGLAGSPLPYPLKVKVTDSIGGISSVNVKFIITAGGGSFTQSSATTATVTTDSNGVAQVNYTLNSSPYVNHVRAEVVGYENDFLPVVFVLTGQENYVPDPYIIDGTPYSKYPIVGYEHTESITLKNVSSAAINLEAISIVPGFDSGQFSLVHGSLAQSINPGSVYSFDLVGFAHRVGWHRIDIQFQINGNFYEETFMFESVLPSIGILDSEIIFNPKPGGSEIKAITVECPVGSDGPLYIYEPNVTGDANVYLLDSGISYPVKVKLGESTVFQVNATGSTGGEVESAEIHFPMSQKNPDEESPSYDSTVKVDVNVEVGAWFQNTPFVSLNGYGQATLNVDSLYGHVNLTILNPSVVQFFDPVTGGMSSSYSNAPNLTQVSFYGLAEGEAEIQFEAYGLILNKQKIYVTEVISGAFLYEDVEADVVHFVEFPSGEGINKLTYSNRTFDRNTDIVTVSKGNSVYGLFQSTLGQTYILDMKLGTELHMIPAPGATEAVSGVEPAYVKISDGSNGQNIYGISVTKKGHLVCYDIETGQTVSTHILGSGNSEVIFDDVDMLVHGSDSGTGMPPILFTMINSGQIFANYLPDLAPVTLDGMDAAVQGAIQDDPNVITPQNRISYGCDPRPLGPDAVIFPGRAGDYFILRWSDDPNDPLGERLIGDLTDPRKEQYTDPNNGVVYNQYPSAPYNDSDFIITVDGLAGLTQGRTGVTYILDENGSIRDSNDNLRYLGIPEFTDWAIPGVDPRIARYNPNISNVEDRLEQALGVVGYISGKVAFFSLDLERRWIFEPAALNQQGTDDNQWVENLDIQFYPANSPGNEVIAIVPQTQNEIGIYELLPTPKRRSAYVTAGVLINGVDPLISNDGQYVVAVSREISDCADTLGDTSKGFFEIFGIGESNKGFQKNVPFEFISSKADVDLIQAPDGSWVGMQDGTGALSIIELGPAPGTILVEKLTGATMHNPVWPRSVIGIDMVLAKEGNPTEDDEDWVVLKGGECEFEGIWDRNEEWPDLPPAGREPPPEEYPEFDDLYVPTNGQNNVPFTETKTQPVNPYPIDRWKITVCLCIGETHDYRIAAQNYEAQNNAGGVSTIVEVTDIGDTEPVRQHGEYSVIGQKPGFKDITITYLRPNGQQVEGTISYIVNAIMGFSLSYEFPANFIDGTWMSRRFVDSGSSVTVETEVDPTHKGCLVVPCGVDIEIDAAAALNECKSKLGLDDTPFSTQVAGCPLRHPDNFACTGWNRFNGKIENVTLCGTNRVGTQCETNINTPEDKFGTLSYTVIAPDQIRGPDQITIKDKDVPYRLELCDGSTGCMKASGDNECEFEEQKKKLVARLGAQWALVDPNGNNATGTHLEPDLQDPLLVFITCPTEGEWKLIAKFGNCEVEKIIDVIDPKPNPVYFRPGLFAQLTGDPIKTQNGELIETGTDLMVQSRGINFEWTRRYRNQSNWYGALGKNWDFNYNESLTFEDVNSDGAIDIIHWHTLVPTLYLGIPNDINNFITPEGSFTKLRLGDVNGEPRYLLRYKNGKVHEFYTPGAGSLYGGKLNAISDASGNRMTFHYSGMEMVLTNITDTMGRVYVIGWSANNENITTVTDFTGRTIEYSYYGSNEPGGVSGLLKSVSTPDTEHSADGSVVAAPRRTIYTYHGDEFDLRLRDNIKSIIRPNEVQNELDPGELTPAFSYVYGTDLNDPLTYDRVLVFTHGGQNATGAEAGGSYRFYFEELAPSDPSDLTQAASATTVVDRAGNVSKSVFNSNFNLIEEIKYSGRVDTSQPIPYPVASRGAKVRDSAIPGPGRPTLDPDSYSTKYEYNSLGLQTKVTFPEGNSIEYIYPFINDANPFIRGNLSEVRWIADVFRGTALGGSGEPERVVKYEYEPWTNKISKVIEAKGNQTDYDGPDLDSTADNDPSNYTKELFFDYQGLPQATVEPVFNEWGIEVPAGFQFEITNSNNIQIGEGRFHGKAVHKLQSSTRLSWSGSVIQELVEDEVTEWKFNDFGQLVENVDGEGNIATFEYYSEQDPDGDGSNIDLTRNGSTGGYLKRIQTDAEINHPQLEYRKRFVNYSYNANGTVSEIEDNRGVKTLIERNTLGEPIKLTRGVYQGSPTVQSNELFVQDLSYETEFEYDRNGNVISYKVQNVGSGVLNVDHFVEDIVFDILDQPIERYRTIDSTTTAFWAHDYDPNGNLLSITQPEGTRTEMIYDERDLLYQKTRGISDPDPNEWAILKRYYDHNGNLTFIEDSQDNDGDGLPEVTEYQYDGWDRVKLIVDAAGQARHYRYDVTGRVVSTWKVGSRGGPTPRRSDPWNHEVLNSTRFTYDERGRLLLAEQSILNDEYEAGFELEEGSLTPSDGWVSMLFKYDRVGRIIESVDDKLLVHKYTYNEASQIKSREVIDENQIVTSRFDWEYDRQGNPFKITETERRPDGINETYASYILWDALNRPARQTDPDGKTVYRVFDSRGFNTVIAGPQVNNSNIIADPAGIAGDINLPGNTRRMIADGLGRTVEVHVDLRTGGVGDGILPSGPRDIPANLDLTVPENPDGIISRSYVYDGNSRLTQVLDDRGNGPTYEYDHRGQIKKTTLADGSIWTSTYDRDGHRSSQADPRGVVKTFLQDGLGRLTDLWADNSNAPDVIGTTHTQIEWDGLHRVVAGFDNNDPNDSTDDHTVVRSWDSFGNIVSEVQDGHKVNKRFDSLNNPLEVVNPNTGYSVTKTYDALSRLTSVIKTNDATNLRDSTYVGEGYRIWDESFSNGIDVEYRYGYDLGSKSRMLHEFKGTTSLSTTPLFGRAYKYDRRDLKTGESWLERAGSSGSNQYGRAYQTDSTGRLISASSATEMDSLGQPVGTADSNYQWTLDGVSNWVSTTKPSDLTQPAGSTDTENYSYDQVNQPQVGSNPLHLYDQNGSRAEDGRFLYFYDAFNRLKEIRDATDSQNPLIESYTYDAWGRRVTETVVDSSNNIEVTRFVYDREDLIEEHSNGQITANYFGSGVDDLVAREKANGDLHIIHTDAGGSSVALSDSQGNIVERYDYSPFGEVLFLDAQFQVQTNSQGYAATESAVGNPFLFQGRRLSKETGFYDFRSRTYDPHLGRFLERDPMNDVLNFGNQYPFPGNNPSRYIDPYGMSGDLSGFLGDSHRMDALREANNAAASGDVDGYYDALADLYGAGRSYEEQIELFVQEVQILINKYKDKLARIEEEMAWINDALDTMQDFLDVASIVLDATGVGAAVSWVPDLLNAGISAARGDYVGAGLSLAASIPFAGALGNAARLGRRIDRASTGSRRAGRTAGKGKGGIDCHCFSAGTKIQTDEELKPIEDIEVGDKVLAKNLETDTLEYREVVQLIQWESKPAVELDIQNAEGESETIVVTPSHPFYVEDKGWVPAGKLGDCDKIVSAEGGALHVIQIRPVPGGLPVFNFTVEGLSNYFVGELGGLVHNAPCGDDPLDWSIVSNRGETRQEHVRKHGNNNLQKENHGVFYGDPVQKTNEAWSNKGNAQPTTNNGVDIYKIESPNAGYSGGYAGQGENLNNVTVITKTGTNQVITSFPSS